MVGGSTSARIGGGWGSIGVRLGCSNGRTGPCSGGGFGGCDGGDVSSRGRFCVVTICGGNMRRDK